jgi:Heparinase II/III N-terminus/Heparinase II/III-like protein
MRSLKKDKEIAIFYTNTQHRPFFNRWKLLVIFYLKVLSHFILRKCRKFFKTRQNRNLRRKMFFFDLPELATIAPIQYLNLTPNGSRSMTPYEFASELEIPLATRKIRFGDLWDSAMRSGDEQDQYARYRLRFLPMEIRAHGDGTYDLLAEVVRFIRMDNLSNRFFWNAYTVSERLIHLAWATCLLSVYNEDVCKKHWFEEMCWSMLQQASYLYKNFEFDLGHHNHLINNSRALLTVSILFPDSSYAKEWSQYAIKTFKNEWPYQVLPDGVHAEQSSSYHFLLTRTLWEMKYLFEQIDEAFPFSDDLEKMIRYARLLLRPDGTIPFLGHITPDWPWKELAGLIPVWGYEGYPLSTLGSCYKMKPGRSGYTDDGGVYCFENAGQGIIRSPDLHVVLSCDPRCTIATHGDQNMLGIDIWYKGFQIVRDAGLDSYDLDENRTWFESWKGQSTFVIDGMEPLVSNWRKRQLPEQYYRSIAYIKRYGDNGLEASHNCYLRLPDPVKVMRKVISESMNIIILDRSEGKDIHLYQAIFHFGDMDPEFVPPNSLNMQNAAASLSYRFTWDADLNHEIIECPYAVGYGEKRMGRSVIFSTKFSGTLHVEYRIQS